MTTPEKDCGPTQTEKQAVDIMQMLMDSVEKAKADRRKREADRATSIGLTSHE